MSRTVLAKLGLMAASLAVTLILLELALRVAFYHSKDFSMEMWKYAVQLKQNVPDPKLSFVHIPNGNALLMGVDVKTNAQGLRDFDYSFDKPQGVYRIVMLGDSTTLGWGVPLESTSAKILERDLNADQKRKFQVLNAGVGNYDTVQEVEAYKTSWHAFHPDLVILVFSINDPEPVPSEKKDFVNANFYLWPFFSSRFDGFLRSLGTRPSWEAYYKGLYKADQPGLQPCEAALKDLASATNRDRSQLLVAMLPELHQINEYYPFAQEQKQIDDELTAMGVPVVNLIDGLKNHGPESTLWITPKDDHPNAKANALIDAQIKTWILSNQVNGASSLTAGLKD